MNWWIFCVAWILCCFDVCVVWYLVLFVGFLYLVFLGGFVVFWRCFVYLLYFVVIWWFYLYFMLNWLILVYFAGFGWFVCFTIFGWFWLCFDTLTGFVVYGICGLRDFGLLCFWYCVVVWWFYCILLVCFVGVWVFIVSVFWIWVLAGWVCFRLLCVSDLGWYKTGNFAIFVFGLVFLVAELSVIWFSDLVVLGFRWFCGILVWFVYWFCV